METGDEINDFEDLDEKFDEALVLIADIKDRCDKAAIKYTDKSTREEFDIDVCIHFPAGRNTKDILLYDYDDVKTFHGIGTRQDSCRVNLF